MSWHWSKEENAKLIAAVKKATSIDEAVVLAQRALPARKLHRELIDRKLRRLKSPSLEKQIGAKSVAVDDTDKAVEVSQFAAVAKKGLTLEELCNRFDCSPKRIKTLVSAAQEAGYRIDMAGGSIGYTPPTALRSEKKLVAQPGDQEVFAVISDLHVGSKYCLEEQLRDFVIRANKEDGVTQFFLPGDNLDGVYRHSRWEESHHGFHDQAAHFAKVLPRIEGVRYDGIIGNHDETFEKESGLDVCKATEDAFRRAGRNDLRLHGARGAYLRYAPKGGRGILVELWHPLGGGSYAVSYKLQRHIEEYGVGRKPDVVLTGHFHQMCYVERRGVHAFLCGTFHGDGSSFSKALGGAQAIGAWVVKYRQTAEGALRDVSPTWRSYYEEEHVRALGLG